MHTAALKLVENSPTTLETMGLIYAQMGRYGEAIRALQTALPLHTCRTDSTTAVDLLDICVHQYARQLEVPLSLTPVNTTVNGVAITAHTDDFEVGRGGFWGEVRTPPFKCVLVLGRGGNSQVLVNNESEVFFSCVLPLEMSTVNNGRYLVGTVGSRPHTSQQMVVKFKG